MSTAMPLSPSLVVIEPLRRCDAAATRYAIFMASRAAIKELYPPFTEGSLEVSEIDTVRPSS
jgi:hypothetical protein